VWTARRRADRLPADDIAPTWKQRVAAGGAAFSRASRAEMLHAVPDLFRPDRAAHGDSPAHMTLEYVDDKTTYLTEPGPPSGTPRLSKFRHAIPWAGRLRETSNGNCDFQVPTTPALTHHATVRVDRTSASKRSTSAGSGSQGVYSGRFWQGGPHRTVNSWPGRTFRPNRSFFPTVSHGVCYSNSSFVIRCTRANRASGGTESRFVSARLYFFFTKIPT